jgi:hypothetical protein
MEATLLWAFHVELAEGLATPDQAMFVGEFLRPVGRSFGRPINYWASVLYNYSLPSFSKLGAAQDRDLIARE